jgi:hypothetical protein
VPNRKLFTLFTVMSALLGCEDEAPARKTGQSEQSITTICARTCARAAEASCAAASEECVAACEDQHRDTPASCDDEIEAYGRCAQRADFVCDGAGRPVARACSQLWKAYEDCYLANTAPEPLEDASSPTVEPHADAGSPVDASVPVSPQQQPDASAPPPDAGAPSVPSMPHLPEEPSSAFSCAPRADDEVCGACIKDSCCEEIEACGAECQALGACVSECESDVCIDACLDDHPAGIAAFSAFTGCGTESCERECEEEEDAPSPSPDPGAPGRPDLSEICLPGGIPDGICTDPRQPFGYDCPLAQPFPDCTLVANIANVYCCGQ